MSSWNGYIGKDGAFRPFSAAAPSSSWTGVLGSQVAASSMSAAASGSGHSTAELRRRLDTEMMELVSSFDVPRPPCEEKAAAAAQVVQEAHKKVFDSLDLVAIIASFVGFGHRDAEGRVVYEGMPFVCKAFRQGGRIFLNELFSSYVKHPDVKPHTERVASGHSGFRIAALRKYAYRLIQPINTYFSPELTPSAETLHTQIVYAKELNRSLCRMMNHPFEEADLVAKASFVRSAMATNKDAPALVYPGIISVQGKQMTVVPSEVISFRFAQGIDFRNNQIGWIFPGLCTMKHLQILRLGNNRLNELPKEIGELTNLTQLDISRNELTNLPCSIGKCQRLSHFLIYGNPWQSLPDEMGGFTADKIVVDLQALQAMKKEVRDLLYSRGQLKNPGLALEEAAAAATS